MFFPNIEVIDAIDQQLAISECLAYIGFDKEREHGVTVLAAIDVAVLKGSKHLWSDDL